MKKVLFALIVFCMCQTHAQEKSKTPEAAKVAFHEMFPNATSAKWGKEENDYEVDFKLNGKKMSALFDAKGNHKETEEAVKEADIPAKAITYFKEHYKNISAKEFAKITRADKQILYEIGIKGKDILFDAEGNFVKESKD
jgi:hypothetical protein